MIDNRGWKPSKRMLTVLRKGKYLNLPFFGAEYVSGVIRSYLGGYTAGMLDGDLEYI